MTTHPVEFDLYYKLLIGNRNEKRVSRPFLSTNSFRTLV